MILNKIYCGKTQEIIKEFDDNSIDLVVTSPPYDNLRKYEGRSDFSFKIFSEIVRELYRVVKTGGVVVWNVADQTINGSETLSSFRQAIAFVESGFNLNDTMIWRKTNPMPQVKQPRYNQCFEYMFVFSKGKPRVFNPEMVKCKSIGGVYNSTCKVIGGEGKRVKKTFILNDEKVVDNVWEFAVAQNRTKRKHPAVFPYELPYRHIKTWTNVGDVVLDPFSGSGTTLLAARDLNRRYVGIEINPQYVADSIVRLKNE